jgi:hypothetical protein
MGTLKDMVTKSLEMGVCFHRDSVWGNMEGRSFPRAFERSVSFFYQENFC